MNIKATFPAGATAITVHGLHQWDYGRTLEITAPDLPAVVEVHFACPGMKEAVVRVCSAANGTASAVIPDRCLEQTAPITAWVFVTDDTAGFTAKTITLPVIPRVKPQPGESVPEEHYDKYTELIGLVNGVVTSLTKGDVKVKAAAEADHAAEAGHADTAGIADTAGTADNINITLTDTVNITEGKGTAPALESGAAYFVILQLASKVCSGIFIPVLTGTHAQVGQIGNYTMNINTEMGITFSQDGALLNAAGTLSFYKIGGMTE